MSETRRTVSVEIVYDGDRCGLSCPFFSSDEWDGCSRFKADTVNGERCDDCKAEDAPFRPYTEEEMRSARAETSKELYQAFGVDRLKHAFPPSKKDGG